MSIVHLRMVVLVLVLVLEQRRVRGEGHKCVDVVKGMSEVVVDAQYLILVAVVVLTGEVAEEVSGCLFVVIAMSSMIHAEVEVEVGVVEARCILSALLVQISILRAPLLLPSRNLLLLLQHQRLHLLQHQRHMK